MSKEALKIVQSGPRIRRQKHQGVHQEKKQEKKTQHLVACVRMLTDGPYAA